MKKTRYVFASLAALALVATACGSDKNTTSTARTGGTTAQLPQPLHLPTPRRRDNRCSCRHLVRRHRRRDGRSRHHDCRHHPRRRWRVLVGVPEGRLKSRQGPGHHREVPGSNNTGTEQADDDQPGRRRRCRRSCRLAGRPGCREGRRQGSRRCRYPDGHDQLRVPTCTRSSVRSPTSARTSSRPAQVLATSSTKPAPRCCSAPSRSRPTPVSTHAATVPRAPSRASS